MARKPKFAAVVHRTNDQKGNRPKQLGSQPICTETASSLVSPRSMITAHDVLLQAIRPRRARHAMTERNFPVNIAAILRG
jgi:hypothetical protein